MAVGCALIASGDKPALADVASDVKITQPDLPIGARSCAANSPGEPYGLIGEKYLGPGSSGGPLGMPTGSECDAPHGGRCHKFQRGTICWHPRIGEAFAVWGMIHAKWAQFGRVEF